MKKETTKASKARTAKALRGSKFENKPHSLETTERFMQVVGEMMMQNRRTGGPYKDYRGVAESLHCSFTVFAQYQKLTRNVTIEMCYYLSTVHGINLNWLITGKGEKFLKDTGGVDGLEAIEKRLIAIEKELRGKKR
jgi:hypothetical protein